MRQPPGTHVIGGRWWQVLPPWCLHVCSAADCACDTRLLPPPHHTMQAIAVAAVSVPGLQNLTQVDATTAISVMGCPDRLPLLALQPPTPSQVEGCCVHLDA